MVCSRCGWILQIKHSVREEKTSRHKKPWGPPFLQDFFKIMQFSGDFNWKYPILSKFWTQDLPPRPKSWIRAYMPSLPHQYLGCVYSKQETDQTLTLPVRMQATPDHECVSILHSGHTSSCVTQVLLSPSLESTQSEWKPLTGRKDPCFSFLLIHHHKLGFLLPPITFLCGVQKTFLLVTMSAFIDR